MPPASDSSQSTSIAELITTLDARAGRDLCSLAFDGDGTLWVGDVSDDVFLAACERGWLLPEVRPALVALLEQHAQPTHGSASELALRLFECERLGLIEERLSFEMMTWCYAGRSVRELSEFAERVLSETGIEARVRSGYNPLLDWAKAAGHTCWLVTASPWPIVRVAASRLGFAEHQILAAHPRESATGLIEVGLLAPLPYREQKVRRLNEKCAGTRLLAAFGDSHFDAEMLSAAEVAVAVNPKPALQLQLQSMAHALVLHF